MKISLDPDEIFLDARNLPSFDEQQFEGQIEKPIARKTFYIFGFFFLIIGFLFVGRSFSLQFINGEALAARSANNTLRQKQILPDRGVVNDRFGEALIWNDQGRHYIPEAGFAHLLGYLGYPNEEEVASERYESDELVGRDGVEKIFNDELRGTPGVKIEEIDATGKNQSDYLLQPPSSGQNLILSIDSRIQKILSGYMRGLIDEGRFIGGAGVMLDVETGEIIALTSLPEYDRTNLSVSLNDERHPFLNRAVSGAYTPGSIVKPIIAMAALNEHLIDPAKKILSTGELVVPNPFFPDKPSIFKDWKAHGWVDLRRALAVSSDVYFYTVGGGFADQAGLGIKKIAAYAKLFGLGEKPGSQFTTEEAGVVPTPEWKAENFAGASWLLGDTYHTAIGQYSFQVTPLQMARVVAAVANGGRLIKPTILAPHVGETATWSVIPGLDPAKLEIVREGMREGVTDGTVTGLKVPAVAIAAKTGTAELGTAKDFVHSWVTGFFPYENPHYAFAVVMERGQRSNLIGATFAMRETIDWMAEHTPEYFKH